MKKTVLRARGRAGNIVPSLRVASGLARVSRLIALCCALGLTMGCATNQSSTASKASPVALGGVFRDCANCPEMVVVPAGRFRMGGLAGVGYGNEKPVREVMIARPFALAKHEVTRGEFSRFVNATEYATGGSCYILEDGKWNESSGSDWRSPGFRQTEEHPVVCVGWDDAAAYARWLSSETGEAYRLPSEAEWEYATRAGSTTKYHFGNDEWQLCRYGNGADQTLKKEHPELTLHQGYLDLRVLKCRDGYVQTAPVGSFAANAFGLHDMHGNVMEWVEDCWRGSYEGAPDDGTARLPGACSERVLRGGSWRSRPEALRAALRLRYYIGLRSYSLGFRVARTLTP